MNIKNNLSSWLYFLPFFIFFLISVVLSNTIVIIDILILLFGFCISFIDIKLFQYFKWFVFWLAGFFSIICCIPLFWSIDSKYSIFISLFFIVSFIMFSIAEYEWHKKIKTNIKKSILIFSILFLFLSFSVFQYIENKKADNFAMYICEKSSQYKNIDELNKVFVSEEIMNKLYTKKPRTEQFGDSILFHYYNIRRPFGLFSEALISCEIKTDMQGNILSHEIK